MPAGSLIFVIVVAIWAAYLIQHWVRRQENTAAARSVERFSKAMRVLERRPPAAAPEPVASHPRGGPTARVIRPVVDVKRATPAGEPRRSPLVARSSPEPALDSHEVDPMPQIPHQAPAVSLAQRRVRAALLLVSLAWVPTSVVLVVLDLLLWISIPFSLLTVVAVVIWLRTEAMADRVRRETHHRHAPMLSSDDTQVIRPEAVREAAATYAPAGTHVHHAPAGAHGRPSTGAGAHDRPTPAATTRDHPAAATPPAQPAEPAAAHTHAPVVAEAGAAAYERVFDLEAVKSQPVPVQEPAEGTWAPVPVPPPTYAMKAKAEPRLTASGIPADVFDTPEFAEEAEELDERARWARRAVSE